MDRKLKVLGENIRRIRHLQGLSQEELAHRSGLHRTYMSDVERGRRNISFHSLVAIAEGLNLSVSVLTEDIGSVHTDVHLAARH